MSRVAETLTEAVEFARLAGNERLADKLAALRPELRLPDDPPAPLYLVLDNGMLGMGIGKVVDWVPVPRQAGLRSFVRIAEHDWSRGPLHASDLVGDAPRAGNRLRTRLLDLSRWLVHELSAEAAAEVVSPVVRIGSDGVVRYKPGRPVITRL